MKKQHNGTLFFALLLSTALFTGAALTGEDTLYASYSAENGWMTPRLALVFQGMKDGIYPWQPLTEIFSGEKHKQDGLEVLGAGENPGNGQQDGISPGAQTVSGAVSGNAGGDENFPGQLVSGNGGTAVYDRFGTLISQSQNALPVISENGTNEDAETGEKEPERTLGRVEEDSFRDALFIGDSRTVGLQDYGGFPEETTFYAATSLTIYHLFEEPRAYIVLEDGRKVTLEEALQERTFSRIYIMLGINELGRGTTESFFVSYANAVNRIRMLQPDALIFIQGIMRVGGPKSRTDPVFRNEVINERNQALALMADNRHIFYLEVNDAVCDENGDLTEDYTFDQVHLKAKYYSLWKEYLLDHGVE